MLKNLSRSTVIALVLAFLLWRGSLFGIAAMSNSLLPYKPSFPYPEMLTTFDVPSWVSAWGNFDGVHYLTIIHKGYFGTGLIQAFFPLYPLLAKALNTVLHNALLASLVISNLAALVVMVCWFSWLKRLWDRRTAWIGTGMLFLFPTALFFGATYTESLFTLLVIGSLMAAQQKTWWLSGILAALASATRVVGIALVPALLVELYVQSLKIQTTAKETFLATLRFLWQSQKSTIAWIALGSIGLIGYMTYLHLRYADALYFLHVQSEFGTGREEGIILYPQVVWRYFKILATLKPINWFYFAVIQEFVVGILAPLILLLATLQPKTKLRWSWILFSWCLLLLPVTTGTFTSLARYILPCIAIWMWLLQEMRSRTWLVSLYLLFSTVILIINTVLFVQGYWVA